MSKYFHPHEFRQKARHGFAEAPYPAKYSDRLRRLCAVLDVIREAVGRPIVVTSGYRSPEYNRKIGGAKNSQHVQGTAADIQCKGMSPAKLHELILQLYKEGKLPALGGLGLYPSFVHVDVRVGSRLARWGGSRVGV